MYKILTKYIEEFADDKFGSWVVDNKNDGMGPVIFKIESIDIPENDDEREWLEKQKFKNSAEDAYTG